MRIPDPVIMIPPTSWLIISSEVIFMPLAFPLQKLFKRFFFAQSYTLKESCPTSFSTTEWTEKESGEWTYLMVSDSLAITRWLSNAWKAIDRGYPKTGSFETYLSHRLFSMALERHVRHDEWALRNVPLTSNLRLCLNLRDDLFVSLLTPHLVIILNTPRLVWFRLLYND